MKSLKSLKTIRWREQPFVSGVLVVINVIVFGIYLYFGDDLLTWGQVDGVHVFGQGEYGRVIYSMFLHADFQHLVSNMFILLFLGMMIEKAVGHVRFVFFYFFSGICGNLVSLYFKAISGEYALGSIGASGAIFGLEGVLLALVLLWGEKLEDVTLVRVLFMVGYSVYAGFLVQNVDNAAHVGGLLTGFLWAVVMCLVEKRRLSSKES